MTAVSGQVIARDTKSHVHDFPSDVELAQVVFPLPVQCHNKFLVADVPGLSPVTEAGYLLKVFIDHDQDLLARHGHLGIVDLKGQPYAGGVNFEERKRLLKDRQYFLRDPSGSVKAMTAVDGNVDYVNACIIYGLAPLVDTPPHRGVVLEDGVAFYPWFRVVDDHPEFTSIDYYDGAAFKPFLRARPDRQEHTVGLLIKSASEHHTVGHLVKVRHGGKLGWDVTCAPGVDPAMMLCITAAMEYVWGGKGHHAYPSLPNPFAKK
jgi:hypothetical protein